MAAEVLEQLSKMIANELRQQLPQPAPQPAPQQPQPTTGWPSLGLPAGQMPFGQQPAPTPFIGGTLAQPTGVSVPVVVPLADGREVHVRVHFPAEALANLQNLLNYCAQAWGNWLVARRPYRNDGYRGWGNNYYGRGRGR